MPGMIHKKIYSSTNDSRHDVMILIRCSMASREPDDRTACYRSADLYTTKITLPVSIGGRKQNRADKKRAGRTGVDVDSLHQPSTFETVEQWTPTKARTIDSLGRRKSQITTGTQ